MNCEKIVKQLCDELAEDVNSEVCLKIRQHLENCCDCRNQLASVRNTVNLFRCLEQRDVPENIHARLVQLLNVGNIAK